MNDPIAAKIQEIIKLRYELEAIANASGSGISPYDKKLLSIDTKNDEVRLLERQEAVERRSLPS